MDKSDPGQIYSGSTGVDSLIMRAMPPLEDNAEVHIDNCYFQESSLGQGGGWW